MKNIIAYSFILFFAGISLVSCLGDLDTMPLDDNQLVSEKVYQTKDGYTGVLAKCYASLVLTGQKGGDGGDGDLEGANEGYSGYVRLLFYLQELSTDNFLMPSSSNGLRKCLNLQWDASNASVITWTYQRLYMSIAYCNELLRECTEGKLQSRGLWEEMKDDYVSYRAEARFIRAYCYSMLCDLFGAVPYVDENTGVKEIPVQYTRKQIFEFAESELLAIENELKAPGSNEYGRVDRVAGWFLLARMYLNAQTWINENKYQEAYAYAVKVIAVEHDIIRIERIHQRYFSADITPASGADTGLIKFIHRTVYKSFHIEIRSGRTLCTQAVLYQRPDNLLTGIIIR